MVKKRYYSQAGQDLFVLEVLGHKSQGTYLEIGSGDPVAFNNTYLMESEYGWKGISVDVDPECVDLFRKTRLNPVFHSNALSLDYCEAYRRHGMSRHVDYLSVDVESDSFDALCKIDLSKHTFSVITFEHNLYTGSETIRRRSRKLLLGYGYTLVAEDVMNRGRPFEDWYVDVQNVDSKWQRFYSEQREWCDFF